jgi:hypothetical protein
VIPPHVASQRNHPYTLVPCAARREWRRSCRPVRCNRVRQRSPQRAVAGPAGVLGRVVGVSALCSRPCAVWRALRAVACTGRQACSRWGVAPAPQVMDVYGVPLRASALWRSPPADTRTVTLRGFWRNHLHTCPPCRNVGDMVSVFLGVLVETLGRWCSALPVQIAAARTARRAAFCSETLTPRTTGVVSTSGCLARRICYVAAAQAPAHKCLCHPHLSYQANSA